MASPVDLLEYPIDPRVLQTYDESRYCNCPDCALPPYPDLLLLRDQFRSSLHWTTARKGRRDGRQWAIKNREVQSKEFLDALTTMKREIREAPRMPINKLIEAQAERRKSEEA